MTSRDWWPVVPELVPVLQQGLGNEHRISQKCLGRAAQLISGSRLASESVQRGSAAQGSSWWTPGSLVNRVCAESFAVTAAKDDSGPPTPESEDIATSVLASASVEKGDEAQGLPAGCECCAVASSTGIQVGGSQSESAHSGALGSVIAKAERPRGVHVLYTGLFIGQKDQQRVFARVRACHENVTADHVTLSHKPAEIAPTLPLGEHFYITATALVADDRTQVLSVHMPADIAAHFCGAVPHITVSYSAGARAKEAGDLLAEVCSGSDRLVRVEVWQIPLIFHARVGAKLSSGELVFSHEQLSEALNVSAAAAAPSQPTAAGPQAARETRVECAAPVDPATLTTSAASRARCQGSKQQHRPSLVEAWEQGRKATLDHRGSQADRHVRFQEDPVSKHREAESAMDAAAEDLPEDVGDEDAQFRAILELDALLNALEYAPNVRSLMSQQEVGSAETRQEHRTSGGVSQHRASTDAFRGSRRLFSKARQELGRSSRTGDSNPTVCTTFIRKRGMPSTTHPPTVLEFEGEGSLVSEQKAEHTAQQLAPPPVARQSDSSSEQPAVLGTCSREEAPGGPTTVPQAQAGAGNGVAQPSQSQAFTHRSKRILAASELGAASHATDLVAVWHTAGGISQQSQASAEHIAQQPSACVQTELDDNCDSFWDAEGISCSRGSQTSQGCSAHNNVQYAVTDTKLEGLEHWRLAAEQFTRTAGAASSAAIAADPGSTRLSPLQPAMTAASPAQTIPSVPAWPHSALSSPGQDATAAPVNPVKWPCQSEVLLQVRCAVGGPAAVSAAQATAARAMAERELARSLADAERRTSLVHRSARDVFSQAAADAFQQGQKELARELVNKCREHDRLAVEARFRANEAAFDGSNRHLLNRWKVDLHGLHVDEALKVLETHLIALGGLGHPGGILLQVIVGLGRHSVGGVARILPAVVRYLTDAGYNFTEEPNNAGVICVLLPGKRNALRVHSST